MSEFKADILLHPIRMRIIQALINEALTVQQMKEHLPDIPQATLYRHLKKLHDTGTIFVVDEQPIRGTVEKVYALHPKEVHITADDIKNFTREDYMGLFMKYMATLMADYERYVSTPPVDFAKDGVSLRQASVFLTDEEFNTFIHDLSQVFAKVTANKSAPGRTKRTIATMIIPEAKE